MPTEIPENFELAANTILVKADRENDKPICTGVVYRISRLIHGSASGLCRLIVEIPDPNQPSEPEIPPNPPIGTLHGYVVFNLERAQEVSIDGEDYFLVDASGVLGFLPVPFVELE